MQKLGKNSELTVTNQNNLSCDELNSKQVNPIISQETVKGVVSVGN